MAIIKGKEFAVSLPPTGKIAGAVACDLNIDADTIEVSSPTSDEWRDFICGRKKWEISSNHLVSIDNFNLFKDLIGQKIDVEFVDDVHNMKFSGKAICTNVKISSSVESLCKGSFKFLGCGKLK